jgi:hypothetical protein
MLALYMLYGNQMIKDELLKVNIELVCAKSDLKSAKYEIEGLKRQIDILKECIDNDIKRRMEVLD